MSKIWKVRQVHVDAKKNEILGYGKTFTCPPAVALCMLRRSPGCLEILDENIEDPAANNNPNVNWEPLDPNQATPKKAPEKK